MARRTKRKGSAETLRLVGYARVSTDEQASEGVSLNAQVERLKAYATAHGHELVKVVRDSGVSGKTRAEDRPGMGRVLRALEKGEADGVVAIKLDRYCRDTRCTLDLVERCDREGWRLISVGEHLDTATAAGRLVVTVLAALAQMEREQVGERTTFALEAIAREGRGRSRIVPFGWRTASGKTTNAAGDRRPLKPHQPEQRALAQIIELRDEGNGARRIAKALTGKNPRSGEAWTVGSVAAILRRLDRWAEAGVEPLA